uniref:Uncharacterized protein n=1 Tax=Acrobeloides nanus TaxID=290746 RepID=A0A914C8F0_9BILA
MSMDKFYDTFYSDVRVKDTDDRDLLNAFTSETTTPEYQRAKLIPSTPEYKQKELKCIAGIKDMDSVDSCDSESISTANVNNNKKRPIPVPTRIGYYDESVIEFIERCLSNVAHRPDCKALKEMKFYNDFLKDYEQGRSECALKDIIKQYDDLYSKHIECDHCINKFQKLDFDINVIKIDESINDSNVINKTKEQIKFQPLNDMPDFVNAIRTNYDIKPYKYEIGKDRNEFWPASVQEIARNELDVIMEAGISSNKRIAKRIFTRLVENYPWEHFLVSINDAICGEKDENRFKIKIVYR